jgi:hypothetical protein
VKVICINYVVTAITVDPATILAVIKFYVIGVFALGAFAVDIVQ